MVHKKKSHIIESYYTEILSQNDAREKKYLVQLLDGRIGWTNTVHGHILSDWIDFQKLHPKSSRLGTSLSELHELKLLIAKKTQNQKNANLFTKDVDIYNPMITGKDVGIWCPKCKLWYRLSLIKSEEKIDLTQPDVMRFLPCYKKHQHEEEEEEEETSTNQQTDAIGNGDILRHIANLVFKTASKKFTSQEEELFNIEKNLYLYFKKVEEEVNLAVSDTAKEILNQRAELVYSFYKMARNNAKPNVKLHRFDYGAPNWTDSVIINLIAKQVQNENKHNKVLALDSENAGLWKGSNKLERRIELLVKKLGAKHILSKTSILIPVTSNNHWFGYLIDVDVKTKTLTVTTFDGKNTIDIEMIETLVRAISHMFKLKDVKTKIIHTKLSHKQKDEDSCGIYLALWLLQLKENFSKTKNLLTFDTKGEINKKNWVPEKLRILKDLLIDFLKSADETD